MSQTIKIGAAELPLSLATSGVTILGLPETGKTMLCRLIAEQLMTAGVPVCISDPKGDYWGLRLTKDGKKASPFDIAIFGGDHGDLELTEHAGKTVADAVVDARSSTILDLSHFESDASRARFITAFMKRLYFRKKDAPFPLELMLDEVDLLAPQVPVDQHERNTLHATVQLRKLGRKRGVGVLGNTQRSSRVHKDLVEMSDLLVFTQLAGRNDVKMIADVLKYQLDAAELRDMLGQIGRLQKGEAYFYSPAKFKMNGVVKVPLASTFDSSRTPEFGEAEQIAQPKPIDLGTLRKSIAEAGTNLDHEDIEGLKAAIKQRDVKIAQLERDKPQSVEMKTERVETMILSDAHKAAMERLSETMRSTGENIQKALPSIEQAFRDMVKAMNAYPDAKQVLDAIRADVLRIQTARQTQPTATAVTGREVALEARVAIGKGERTVLIAIAQHPEGVTREQLTQLTGYKRSTRDAYVQRLRSSGYAEVQDSLILATEAGTVALGTDYEPLPTGERLREYWLDRLGEGEARVLKVLAHHYPHEVARSLISDETGYKRSTRDAYLQRLNARRLIDVNFGTARAADALFG